MPNARLQKTREAYWPIFVTGSWDQVIAVLEQQAARESCHDDSPRGEVGADGEVAGTSAPSAPPVAYPLTDIGIINKPASQITEADLARDRQRRQSAKSCGCDPAVGWVCEAHQG